MAAAVSNIVKTAKLYTSLASICTSNIAAGRIWGDLLLTELQRKNRSAKVL